MDREKYPLNEIKDNIQKLFINRYKLIKNILDSNIKKGYNLISQNNKDYENIIKDMKILINIIKNIKNYDLSINTNICFVEYTYFYNKCIDYEI